MIAPLIVALTPSSYQNGTRLSEIATRLSAAQARYRELHEQLHVILRPSLQADWCVENILAPCILTNHVLMQTALYHVRVLEQMLCGRRG